MFIDVDEHRGLVPLRAPADPPGGMARMRRGIRRNGFISSFLPPLYLEFANNTRLRKVLEAGATRGYLIGILLRVVPL